MTQGFWGQFLFVMRCQRMKLHRDQCSFGGDNGAIHLLLHRGTNWRRHFVTSLLVVVGTTLLWPFLVVRRGRPGPAGNMSALWLLRSLGHHALGTTVRYLVQRTIRFFIGLGFLRISTKLYRVCPAYILVIPQSVCGGGGIIFLTLPGG